MGKIEDMLCHRRNFVLFTFHTRYMRVVATHIRLSKEIHAKKLQDFRTQKQEELELKHVKELEDFDTNSSLGSSGSNTLSLKHRSTSSISTVSNSSTSSTRSTENNGTVVQQQTNDERLQVSAGPLRV